jgi:benzaldehyde dehydrogenase (NAD)
MISFTGSTRIGRQVGSVASGLLKRVPLELGGNNPYIVLDDADIEAAASAGAWGAFFHQGQICLTAGRHLVHERVADAYVAAMARKAKTLVVGNPVDERVQVGPIVSERQAANVERIVSETLAKGAKLSVGGSRNGLFFEPTVITGVMPGMAAFDEEIFGPVAPITTFRTDKEATRWLTRQNTASQRPSSRPIFPAPSTWPTSFIPASSTSTTRPSCMASMARLAVSASRATASATAR